MLTKGFDLVGLPLTLPYFEGWIGLLRVVFPTQQSKYRNTFHKITNQIAKLDCQKPKFHQFVSTFGFSSCFFDSFVVAVAFNQKVFPHFHCLLLLLSSRIVLAQIDSRVSDVVSRECFCYSKPPLVQITLKMSENYAMATLFFIFVLVLVC